MMTMNHNKNKSSKRNQPNQRLKLSHKPLNQDTEIKIKEISKVLLVLKPKEEEKEAEVDTEEEAAEAAVEKEEKVKKEKVDTEEEDDHTEEEEEVLLLVEMIMKKLLSNIRKRLITLERENTTKESKENNGIHMIERVVPEEVED